MEPAALLQGENGDLVGFARMGIGKVELMLKRPAKAAEQFRTTMESRGAVLGEQHRQTQVARMHLVDALWEAEDWDGLETPLGDLLDEDSVAHPSDPRQTANVATMLGVCLRHAEKYELAAKWLETAHGLYQEHLPEDHNAVWPMIELVRLHTDQGLLDQAREWNARVPEEVRNKLPEDSR